MEVAAHAERTDPSRRCDRGRVAVAPTAAHAPRITSRSPRNAQAFPIIARPRPAAEIESELLELTGQLNAATYRWLVLLREFDACGGWHGAGMVSLAHWLNWKCGIDLGAAREKVRVAMALAALPRVAAAMSRGALSYSKARAITRVATPETEEYLLGIAAHGTAAHVERLVRAFRRALDVQELGRERAQQEARTVQWRVDDDGSYVVHARLPAESGALVVRALDAAVQAMPAPHVSAETYVQGRPMRVCEDRGLTKSTWAARRADALAAMAETFLQHGFDALAGGDRQQIVVHVDVETLATCGVSAARGESATLGESDEPWTQEAGRDHEIGRCELEGGPSLATETARRLCCDAGIVTILERDGEPLNVGRRTRAIPSALRRALENRDRGCRFPGCTHTRFVDGHHVQHWSRGGETKLSNLVLLCRYHHRLVHEGGYGVERLDDGAFRFVRPDGRAVHVRTIELETTAADALDKLRRAHLSRDIRIDASTAAGRWTGEIMDYGIAVDGLLRLAATRAPDVSAET
jgi:hypothetical protein